MAKSASARSAKPAVTSSSSSPSVAPRSGSSRRARRAARSKPAIVSRTLLDLPPSETDWARVDTLIDADIVRAVASAPDAAPIADEDFLANARLVPAAGGPKEAIPIRLDQDVLRWFRNHGAGYQTRINAVLRAFMEGRLIAAKRPGRKPRSAE